MSPVHLTTYIKALDMAQARVRTLLENAGVKLAEKEHGLDYELFILRRVILAYESGKPHDVSSLAAELEMPVTSTLRRARKFEKTGAIKLKREGRRTLVLPGDWYHTGVLDEIVTEGIRKSI